LEWELETAMAREWGLVSLMVLVLQSAPVLALVLRWELALG
jgi:hypothetical protein